MKKSILALLFLSILSLSIISCNQKSTSETEQKEIPASESTVQYTCPMHPEVITDKPGSCPKCGMDLVKKEAQHNGEHHEADTSMKM